MLELFFVGRLSDNDDTQPFSPGSKPTPKRTKTTKPPSATPRTSKKTDYKSNNELEQKDTKQSKKEKDDPDFEWI